jgi:hypothetical protein
MKKKLEKKLQENAQGGFSRKKIKYVALCKITSTKTTLPCTKKLKKKSYTNVMQLSPRYYNYYATIPLKTIY